MQLNIIFTINYMEESKNNPLKHFVAGMILMQKSEFQKAMTNFDEYGRSGDEIQIAAFAKACTYLKMDMPKEAHECLSFALHQFGYAHNIQTPIEVPIEIPIEVSVPQISKEPPRLEFML